MKRVLHHDDPPCSERLVDGYCPSCKCTPDMQSTALHNYCEKCEALAAKCSCPKPVLIKNTRPETGAMCFGKDWPGVFIRGDRALYWSQIIHWMLESKEVKELAANGGLPAFDLRSLGRTLSSCFAIGGDPPDTQKLKSFGECEIVRETVESPKKGS